MPIAKMKRLQVLALERDHDALLRQLERMGCVEISEPDAPDAPESLRRCDSETADCLARQRQVQTAIDALRRAAPPKKAPLLAPRPAIGEAEYLSETGLADGLALARQVNEAAGRLQQLTALAAQLETDRITLGPWLSLDLPLELTETRCCDVTLGVLPPLRPLGRTVWAGTKRISGERAASALRRPAAAVRAAHHPQGSDGTGAGAAAGPGLPQPHP